MKREIFAGLTVGLAAVALAMPTKKDLQVAQPIVMDVTIADVKALKAGTKKPSEVAARHEELAEKASSEAGKFLLLQGAFKLYAKAGDYEAAANVLERLQTEISDFNPEVTVDLCSAEFIRKMRENAPRLYALKENARRIVFYRKQLPIREAALKKNPKDPLAIRKLGECHAELGDWMKALDVFAMGADRLGKTAAGEKSGLLAPQDAADFWWDYETKSETPVYKFHAAALYRTALASADFKGLVRERAESRVKEVGSVAAVQPVVAAAAVPAQPVKQETKVLDLGCKRKLELIHCPAGSFVMGESENPKEGEVRKHKVKITRPFWLAKVPVSHAQWDMVLGKKTDVESDGVSGGHPIWEKNDFFKELNKRFASERPKGYVFRLPTEAEYSYAITSGGSQIINRATLGLDRANMVSWGNRFKETIGRGNPTAWGFTDVLRHADIEFLDVVAIGQPPRNLNANAKITASSYADEETDPLSYLADGNTDCKNVFNLCAHPDEFWGRTVPTGRMSEWNTCFRVCLGPDLVAEKKTVRK